MIVEDDPVQPPGRPLDTEVRWSGDPGGNGDQPARPRHEAVHQRFHRRARLGRVAADLGVEERLGDDLERQPHHVGLDVADLAVAPGHEHPLGVFDHHTGIGGDPVAMERRLGELALGPPELALAGQEPVAQRSPRAPQPVVLDELPVLVDQHLLDQVGMVEEEDRRGPEPGPDHVAVLAMPARQCPQAVAAEFPQVAEEPVLPGTGRTLCLRACLRTHADILETLKTWGMSRYIPRETGMFIGV